mmetsp:Transcript_53106/g.168552  ORF Transcript_53106/g.168552 Transcript_53106/m.168552 type:complete len:200 (-) Transcript_53106:509-1108(-)
MATSACRYPPPSTPRTPRTPPTRQRMLRPAQRRARRRSASAGASPDWWRCPARSGAPCWCPRTLCLQASPPPPFRRPGGAATWWICPPPLGARCKCRARWCPPGCPSRGRGRGRRRGWTAPGGATRRTSGSQSWRGWPRASSMQRAPAPPPPTVPEAGPGAAGAAGGVGAHAPPGLMRGRGSRRRRRPGRATGSTSTPH